MQKPILRRPSVKAEPYSHQWMPGDYHLPVDSLGKSKLQNIVPVRMLSNYWQQYFNSQKPLWSPLSSTKYQYPPQVQEMLLHRRKNDSSLSKSAFENQNLKPQIGMNQQTYWCFKANRLVIWQYENNQQLDSSEYIYPYPILISQFDMPISAVWVAKVSNIDGILEGSNTIVAVAFGHSLKLFRMGLNQLQSINIVIRSSSYCISRIFIQTSQGDESQDDNNFDLSRQNQYFQLCDIIYSDCDGNIGVFDLIRFKKFDSRPLHRRIFHSLYKQQVQSKLLELVCNQTGPSDLKIHCLVKKRCKQSSEGFLKWISSIFRTPKVMNIIKTFCRNKDGLSLSYTTKQDILCNKLQESYQQFFEKNMVSLRSMKICTIAKMAGRTNDLKIFFQKGLSVIVRDHGYLAFVGPVQIIPQSPQIKGVGVQIESKQNTSFHNIYFATENASISNTSIITRTGNNMHHTASRQENDAIISLYCLPIKFRTHTFSQKQKWIVFNQNFIRVYTALKPSDIVLLYAQIFCQLQSSQQLAHRNHQKINQKMLSLVRIWGLPEFATYVIELLALKSSYKLQIQTQYYQSARTQITSKARPFQKGTKTIRITQHCAKFLEFLLFYYNEQTSSSKEGSGIMVQTDSIWQALNIIFAEKMYPLRQKSPKFFVQNSRLILRVKQQMDYLKPVLRLIIEHQSKQANKDQNKNDFQRTKSSFINQNNKETLWSQKIQYFDQKQQKTLGNDTTRDSLMFDQQLIVVQNSTVKICNKMLIAIPKIKLLIDIYISFGECDKKIERIPSFQIVLSYAESRKIFGQKIVSLYKQNNQILLDQINNVLPELSLQPIRGYYLWKAQFLNFSFGRPADQPTVEAMVSIMNEDNYPQIQRYYTDQEYPQHLFLTMVLLKKLDFIRRQIIDLQLKQNSQYRKDQAERIHQTTLQLEIHKLKLSTSVYCEQLLKIARKICQIYQKTKRQTIGSIARQVLFTIESQSTRILKEQLSKIRKQYSIFSQEN